MNKAYGLTEQEAKYIHVSKDVNIWAEVWTGVLAAFAIVALCVLITAL